MRVYGPHQVFDSRFEFHRRYSFGDQFCRLRADDVDAENLAVVSIADDFDEAFVLANDAGARIRREGKLADLHVVSGFAGFSFGEADATNFRMAIGRAGNVFWVYGLARLARDLGDGDDCFHRSHVGQLRRAQHDVADSIDSRFGRLHPGIRFDELPVGLDFGAVQADVLRARLAADRD